MSTRNKNRRGQSTGASPKPVTHQPASPGILEAKLREAQADALAKVPPGETVVVPNDPAPPGASLDTFWQMVQETRASYEAAERRATTQATEIDKDRKKLEARETDLSKQREQLEQDRSALIAKEADYHDRCEALKEREGSLVDREESIQAREINAEAGFIAQRTASLAALEQAAASLRDQLAETERAIAAERATWLRERQGESERLRGEIEAAAREREQELAHQQTVLREKRLELVKRERQLGLFEERLNEDRASLDERIGHRMAREAEAFKHQLQSVQDERDQARGDRDTLTQKLHQREEADRRFGQRSPEQVLAELVRLRDENNRLEADLAARPDAQAAERLRVLQAERADWQVERIELLRSANEAEGRLAKNLIAVTKLEMLNDQKIAAEARVEVLQKASEELRTEVDRLIGRDDAKLPFPACSALDAAEYQQDGVTSQLKGDLKSFVADLQQRIAHDPQEPSKYLYYSLADLRCFLGGLAMGRLILLQGISGTGKTSLPLAFARAVGTHFKDDDNLIQIQAGWRDPQDLVGHYNAFEKRFYERKFLRALYRASTPRWRDAIHIIVLDEMNLSHPEQYFSDMLSTLEQPSNKRFIELMTHGAPQAPRLFIDGKHLRVPENVWFVGTANHDETTKDFADKTYDRSQVMEFPHRPERFELKAPDARLNPLSYSGLQRAFDKAQKDHGDVAEQVSQFLGAELRVLLGREFGIGWGPRLEEQLKRYCPVVFAAGGSPGEAADHMLAMRLLRKLKNRHDNRQDQLERLRDRIQGAWPRLGAGPDPAKSYAVLSGELARLGIKGEDGQ